MSESTATSIKLYGGPMDGYTHDAVRLPLPPQFFAGRLETGEFVPMLANGRRWIYKQRQLYGYPMKFGDHFAYDFVGEA